MRNSGTRPTPDDRRRTGRASRKRVPRRSHGEWEPRADRPDPVGILEEQGATRVQELLPIRYGRMDLSAFSFFRGAAAVMAWDLAHGPVTGIEVQLCGDAHLSNFGIFASPERRLVFDINDFDEAFRGPFEWDVKRLVASVAIAAEKKGFSGRQLRRAVRATVSRYRDAIRELASKRFLETWYAVLDVEAILGMLDEAGRDDKWVKRRATRARKRMRKAATKRTNLGALEKLAERGPTGRWRIRPEPPLIVPTGDTEEVLAEWRRGFDRYAATVRPNVRALLERYEWVDSARKVVGVGSVGTEAFIALFTGATDDDPLFLQFKEAMASVLEPYVGGSPFSSEGERVVTGQRLIQAASDPFLGWISGGDQGGRDFYVRQLRDGKLSPDVEGMGPRELAAFGRLCGWTLARAHARTGDAAQISGYVGKGDAFVDAMESYATAYARQNRRDHEALGQAIESGRIEARSDL